jgi:hypothetical protein
VKSYKYLRTALQSSGTGFTIHIREKTLTALQTMEDILRLSKLSLETAMKLRDLETVSILAYGLTTVWEHLEENDLKC